MAKHCKSCGGRFPCGGPEPEEDEDDEQVHADLHQPLDEGYDLGGFARTPEEKAIIDKYMPNRVFTESAVAQVLLKIEEALADLERLKQSVCELQVVQLRHEFKIKELNK